MPAGQEGQVVEIFTDGACLGNPGPGGWGAILRSGRHEKELYGGDPVTTNNRMELMAAIQGLESLTRPSAVHADAVLPGQVDARYRLGVGIGVALLILVQVAVACMLIGRTEPASLLLARRRWHRSRSEHAAAVRIHRSDIEAAIIARQGWQNLVDTQVNGPVSAVGRVPAPRSGAG